VASRTPTAGTRESKVPVAVLTGYAATGGGFKNYLGSPHETEYDIASERDLIDKVQRVSGYLSERPSERKVVKLG
jgi:hypothetical protein